jgi:F0F1-type ATP synthase assembly protein I
MGVPADQSRPPRERNNPYRPEPHAVSGPEQPTPTPRSGLMAQLVRVGAIGTDFVVAVIVMGAVGWVLDWALGSRPWLFMTGLLMGIVAGFIRFVRVALAENRRAIEEWQRQKKDPG